MGKRINCVIQSFGKSEQLRCTIASLLKYSKQHIGKIYIIEESVTPFNDKDCKWVLDYFNDIEIEYHKQKYYINPYTVHCSHVPYELIRYQYAIDKDTNKYIFICHNDVLFTGDIIGNMLCEIDNYELNNPNSILAGIGEVGQCHNCPAFNICGGGQHWNDWNPSWKDIHNLKLPHIRTRKDNLHPTVPKLVPECRLNEFACIINREIKVDKKEDLFGQFSEDSGVNWFRAMHLKGYKFKDYRKDFHHAYWANMGGFQVQQKEQVYIDSEQKAKQYYETNF